jgi:site-specific DNA-cytosine methylase
MITRELKVFLPFNGIGIGGKGFLDAEPKANDIAGKWRVIGGADVDKGACENAARILGCPIAHMDLMSREQYVAFHGKQPPDGWREATPADIRRAAGNERPDLVFTSPPCKGYSGLLPETSSRTPKYQALNELALRGIWLCLEAWSDDPPSFFLLENVPRMATRGRRFLDQITGLLQAYGYAVAETTHDCGELGGLAQSRKRFLLVARHVEKVPNYLYQPPRRPLRAVGDVLGKLPIPGTVDLPLHRLPNLQWKTWVRLAFVEAGKDWRSLNRLRVDDGKLSDYGLMPARPWHNGAYGVQPWNEHAGTVTGNGRPAGGTFAVADPRFNSGGNDYSQYGVGRWEKPTGAMINVKSPGQGVYSVADPRVGQKRPLFNHAFRVVRWEREAPAVHGPGGAGGMAVADPRCPTAWAGKGKYIVTPFDAPANTVIAGSTTGNGAFAVADPRPNMTRGKGSNYLTGGHYGVVPWDGTAYAVTGSGQHDNGHNSVADPRFRPDEQTDPNACLPDPADKLACLIIAEDGTWHRPFTTLDVAALQSIFDPEDYLDFELNGRSDSELREWIGNAVPRAAARAIAEQFGQALLLADTGQTFILSSLPVWVRPMIAAMQYGRAA